MATLQQKAKYYETSSFVIITILSYAIIGFLLFVLGYIFLQGYKALSWDFIVSFPKNEMREGGIFPAIIGTLYLMVGSSLVSVPIGIMTAIYLTEYVENVTVLNFIRLGINNLAGVPSVVFGLFGMSVFVIFLDFGSSIIAGSLTLGILNLPLVIRSTEEALLTVPISYREASLSLGATRWQTIYKIVVPTALPGILTGIMLSLGRAAGETAPIMFTCATFYTPFVPDSLFSEVMALPYHIYVLATAGTHIEATRPIQYGTAIVLIVLVLGLNLAGMIMRYSYRKKLKG
ncbi:MAG: phosphate ABC transporter permease PstA [Spirochaetes bacterium]|nr:phosphate ABC transporter permease PstA [Spirochaetota bacterium]MBP8987153.1 phosphate ABC transporter permease PstA [Spirochaetota bacterium]HOE19549.1 phosphate ABC transporter permease PstA [Spirochaetota bacterium]HQL43719.1 phosphate ABC transporter permease PstA [Spirochaetota bacterium]HQQ50285.1 phosphate ABC transporter permease PstA [Spirochaetota bacterium]